jgi:hypothetical protein
VSQGWRPPGVHPPIHPATHPATRPEVDDCAGRTADTVLMTLTDYALDISLIAIVLLQIRGRRLTTRSLLLPVILVGWAATNYLHGIPTTGNDLLLVVATASVGATLGILSGLFTTVRLGPDGIPYAKAGLVAAALWVAGTGTRLAFQVYASHGGQAAIGRFSATHSITSGEAWVAALILMAMGEALARTGVLALRARAVSGSTDGSPHGSTGSLPAAGIMSLGDRPL